jgi:uncharacterized membrane protein HdeD (DUF308 family)
LSSTTDSFTTGVQLDATRLTRGVINALRAAFGVLGVVALVLGVVLLFWPTKTVAAVAIFLGIYFVIAGAIRLAVGIFSRGIPGADRTLDIFVGILLLVGGIFALRNVATSSVALLILIVTIIGIGWIIEGILSLVQARTAPSAGWAIVYGIISIIAGIYVLAAPGVSALFLLTFSSIVLIILGVVGIVRAFTFGRAELKDLAA